MNKKDLEEYKPFYKNEEYNILEIANFYNSKFGFIRQGVPADGFFLTQAVSPHGVPSPRSLFGCDGSPLGSGLRFRDIIPGCTGYSLCTVPHGYTLPDLDAIAAQRGPLAYPPAPRTMSIQQ